MSVVGVGNKYYSAFNPLDLGDCALWLDAADTSTLTLSGSNVTQWRDKTSGLVFSNFTGTPTYSNNFRSGNGVISLFGTSSLNNTTLTISNANYSIFMIAYLQSSNATNYIRILNGGGATADSYLFIGTFNGTANYATFTGSGSAWNDVNSNTPATNILQTWRLMGMTVASSVLTPYLDGTAQNTKTGTTSAFTGLNVGGVYSTNQTQQCFQGYIGEILIYNLALSAVQRQQVEAYLARKWGLLGGGMQSITTFIPTSISGCGLWLDATDSSTLTFQSGNNVSVWTDKTTGIQAQYLTEAMAVARAGAGAAGSPNYPVSGYNINGRNALFFNQAILQAITTQSVTTRTYFLVINVVSPNSGGSLLWPATWVNNFARGGQIQTSSTNITFANQNVANLLNLAYTVGSSLVLSITFNNGTVGMWNTGGGTTSSTGQSSSVLGLSGSSDNYLWIGGVQGYSPTSGFLLGELLEYNSALSTTNRQIIEGYLARKWGLTESLPSTHPYALRGLPTTHLYYSIPPITRGFAPVDIPNCALWLDAADPNSLTLSGSNVTQWNDKSGNGRNTSSTFGNSILVSNAINGCSAIYFNSTAFTGSISHTGTQLHCFVVATMANNGQNPRILSLGNASQTDYDNPQSAIGFTRGGTGTLQIGTVRNSTNSIVSFPNYNTPFLAVSAQYANTQEASVNGATPTVTSSGTSASFNITTYGIGRHVGTNGEQTYIGYIGEMIVYTTYLSRSQRQQVEGYLARKWGLIGGGMQSITTFTPRNISNCALWLDAADSSSIDLSGTSVTRWRDKSGNGYNFTQSDSSRYPVYNGSNAVSFTGNGLSTGTTTQFLDNTSIPISNSAFSIFAVARGNTSQPSINGYNYLIKGNLTSDGFLFMGNHSSKNFATFTGTTTWNDINSNSPAVATANNTLIMEMIVSGSTLTPYYNGNIMTTKTGTTGSFSGIRIGDAQNGFPGYTWNGIVYEVLIYNTTLSTTDRQTIEGYLALKWGLQSSLPSTHPYALRGLPSTHPFISRMPATTVFNPLHISGCALWLDAADPTSLTLSGSNVTQWNDKSGNGRNATQSTLINAPTFVNDSGYSALMFRQSGQQYLVGSSLLNSTSNSIFIVYRTLSPALTQYVFFDYKKTTGGTGQNFVQLVIVGSNTSANIIYSESPVTSKNSPSVSISTSRLIFEMIDSPTNTTQNFYNTGSLLATSYTNGGISNISTDTYGYTLGALRTTSVTLTNTFDGYIYEVIVFTNELTTVQRQQIEGYLAWKWGLNGGYSPSLTTFTPTSVSGCQLWLDAADSNSVTETTGSITNVTNKGNSSIVLSNANGFTYDRTNRAFTNSVASSSRHLGINSSYSQAQPQTLFAVASFSSSSTNPYIIDSRSTQVDVGRFAYSIIRNGANTADVAYAFAGNIQGPDYGLRTQTNISSNTTVLHTLVMNNTSSDVRLNGVTQTYSQSPGTNSMTGITVANRYSDNQSWVGSINEILLYGRGLTLTERQQIEGYLALKWGLQSSLPSSHPYANRSLPSTHPYKLIKP